MHPNEVSKTVIGCAIAVHRELGPGLLESVYCDCFAFELAAAGLSYEKEKYIPVKYKGVQLDSNLRADLIVENAVIVEVKAVIKLDPVFEYQILTYQKLTNIPIGLLINFNVPVLTSGIRRKVWKLSERFAS